MASTYDAAVKRRKDRDVGRKGPDRLDHSGGAAPMERRWFVFGCVLSVFAAGFAAWAFSVRTLTAEQQTILTWILPLSSGFAVGGFAGSLSAKARHPLSGVAVVGSGSFAAWLLVTFLLLPRAVAPDASRGPVPHGESPTGGTSTSAARTPDDATHGSVAAPSPAPPPTVIEQKTTGDESPAIANVGGSVTIKRQQQ